MSTDIPQRQQSWINPLSFFGTAVLIVEGALLMGVRSWFPNERTRLIAFFALLVVFAGTVGLVAYLAIRYPRALMAQFDRVTDSVVAQLSDSDMATLTTLCTKGSLSYTEETKELYKPLRNQGLARTQSGKAMRKDSVLVPTELGKLVYRELQQKRGVAA